ncbi:hypothetical protein Tco_0572590 [Tanacetum coccineum]
MTVINANFLSNFVSLQCFSSLLNALLQNMMAEQNVPAQPPTRTDDQIISVDILSNTNFFQAFTTLANVPAIYLQQFWKTISYNKKIGIYSCQLDEQCDKTQTPSSANAVGNTSLKLMLNIRADMGSNNNIHRRPDSAVHHTGDDYVLGNLKFSLKYLKMVAENTKKTPQESASVQPATKPSTSKVRKGKPAFQLVDEEDEAQQESIPQREDDDPDLDLAKKLSLEAHQEKGEEEGNDADLERALSNLDPPFCHQEKSKAREESDSTIPDPSHQTVTSTPPVIAPFTDVSSSKPSLLVTPPPINTEATTITTSLPEITPFIALQLRVARLEQEMSEVKKTDLSADVLASIRSQVPTAVDNYLGTKLDDALLKKHCQLPVLYHAYYGSFDNNEDAWERKLHKTRPSAWNQTMVDSTKRRRSESACFLVRLNLLPKADDQSSKKPRESGHLLSKQHPSSPQQTTGWQITDTREAGSKSENKGIVPTEMELSTGTNPTSFDIEQVESSDPTAATSEYLEPKPTIESRAKRSSIRSHRTHIQFSCPFPHTVETVYPKRSTQLSIVRLPNTEVKRWFFTMKMKCCKSQHQTSSRYLKMEMNMKFPVPETSNKGVIASQTLMSVFLSSQMAQDGDASQDD